MWKKYWKPIAALVAGLLLGFFVRDVIVRWSTWFPPKKLIPDEVSTAAPAVTAAPVEPPALLPSWTTRPQPPPPPPPPVETAAPAETAQPAETAAPVAETAQPAASDTAAPAAKELDCSTKVTAKTFKQYIGQEGGPTAYTMESVDKTVNPYIKCSSRPPVGTQPGTLDVSGCNICIPPGYVAGQ